MTGNGRPILRSPASIWTTTRSSSSTRARLRTAGSSQSAHASTASRATTPTSARNSRPAASSCRPRVSMLSSIKVFGNLGRGVKSPTFTERFGGAGFADPNPDIKVEQAKSGDVGVETTFADQRIRSTFTFFRNDFGDQISYRFGNTGDGIARTPTSTARRRAASNWSLRYSVRSPGSRRWVFTRSWIPRW